MGKKMACTLLAFVILVLAFLGFSLLHPSDAQNTPDDYLAPHNAARAAVGVAPLVWDANLKDYAQNYADQRSGDCKLVHSHGPYGENIFWGWGRPFNAADAVDSWVDEKQYYDYSSNSCAEGKICGHYTQVVWANTKSVGCGRVHCNSGAFFIICSYDPPGNWEGELPYGQSSILVSS